MQKEKVYKELDLAEIVSNPWNPRKSFEGAKFDQLVNSIKEKGVIEPILVRPLHSESGNGTYEIVAGERRHKASLVASTAKIPCIVQEMSDDVAFEIMTIENLQREDLTPREEAESFKAYIERNGKDAGAELAQRTGIELKYITRRIKVLGLPEKVLKAWGAGKVLFGHLEQFIRLTDEKEISSFYQDILDYGRTVENIRAAINEKAVELSYAKFDKKAEGCCECYQNSVLQRDLFGDDSFKKKGAQCLNGKCFKEKQSAWMLGHWPEYAKEAKTTGFRFRNEVSYGNFEIFHSLHRKPSKECLQCSSFVSLIDVRGRFDEHQACVGDKKCYRQTTKEKEAGKGKAVTGVRVLWHGEFFREAFYETALPEKLSGMAYDDVKSRRVLLASLLKVSQEAREAFGKKYSLVWKQVSVMPRTSVDQALHDAAIVIVMTSGMGAGNRRDIADHVGISLAKEWRITQEYLDKKTIKEILAMGNKLGIFKDAKAVVYLEKLGKKDYDKCNKKELVNIFLQSGADLSGKVPDEILK